LNTLLLLAVAVALRLPQLHLIMVAVEAALEASALQLDYL
jgi:hypothetical protein